MFKLTLMLFEVEVGYSVAESSRWQSSTLGSSRTPSSWEASRRSKARPIPRVPRWQSSSMGSHSHSESNRHMGSHSHRGIQHSRHMGIHSHTWSKHHHTRHMGIHSRSIRCEEQDQTCCAPC